MTLDHDVAEPAVPMTARRRLDAHLHGQTVVVLGADDGIGRETARLARIAGAHVILPGPSPGSAGTARPETTPSEHRGSGDPGAADRLFDEVPRLIDHVLVSGGGTSAALRVEDDIARAHREVDEHLWLPIRVARAAVGRVRPGGTLLFLGRALGGRREGSLSPERALLAARRALIADLGREIAPIRVNLIGGGFADRPLSARLLGATLGRHQDEVPATLPIARVVRPTDVAALAVHIMANTALTGATYDLDGREQIR